MSDQLIDRVRKLYAKAESLKEVGNAAEAALFEAKVQELIQQHNMNPDVVKQDASEQIIALPFRLPLKQRKAWWNVLAGAVVKDTGCHVVFFFDDIGAGVILGRKADAEVASYRMERAVNLAIELGDKAYVKAFHEARRAGNVESARGYRASWLEGFAAGVYQKLKDQDAASRHTNAYGLIRVSAKADEAKEAADKMFSKMLPPPERIPAEDVHMMAKMDGYLAGKEAPLHQAAPAGASNKGLLG